MHQTELQRLPDREMVDLVCRSCSLFHWVEELELLPGLRIDSISAQ